jgi:hypothetical protein
MAPKTPAQQRIEDEPPLGINPVTGEFYGPEDELLVLDPDEGEIPDLDVYDNLGSGGAPRHGHLPAGRGAPDNGRQGPPQRRTEAF